MINKESKSVAVMESSVKKNEEKDGHSEDKKSNDENGSKESIKTNSNETELKHISKIDSMKVRKRRLDPTEDNTNSSFTTRHERPDTSESNKLTSSNGAPSLVKKNKIAPAPWMNAADIEKYEAKEKPIEKKKQEQTYDEEQRLAEERRIRREIEHKSQFIDQTVIQHYNKRTFQSKREKRDESEIIKLRNYHNAIKFILIGTYTNPGDRVLDLGCGKGGDLNKWEKAQICNYIGIDISDSSIREAIRRFRTQRYEFIVSFITGDCFGIPLPTVLEAAHIPIPRELPVDVVSMQFCMHYAFETEEKATTMIRNVAWALKVGGRFIGTIPNSEFIKYKLRNRKAGEKGFGNSLYSVTFPNEIPKDCDFSNNPYGNVYNYYLKDAIDNVPEYVVPFNNFRSLAAQYGLDLIYNKPFAEMFKEHMPVWHRKLSPRMIQSISRRDGKMGLEGDEVDASAFYTSFVFVKSR